MPLPAADAARHALAAVALHHAHGSLEAAMQRIARQIDGDLPQGGDWHQAQLHAMGLSIEGLRPALSGRESVRALRDLLGFRHFFRHGYAELERLRALGRSICDAAPKILAELDAFDRFLAAAARDDDEAPDHQRRSSSPAAPLDPPSAEGVRASIVTPGS